MSHAANPYLVDPAGARSPEPAVEVPVGVVTAPQPYGRVPVRARLGVEAVDGTFELYVVGAHGGAGESVLAELGGSGWRAMQHRWPHVPDRRVSPRVVLVGRTSVTGIEAVRDAAAQWAAGQTPPVELLGAVLLADAPGRLPRGLKDLIALTAGGVPRLWRVPWVEAWRLGPPTPAGRVTRVVNELHRLTDKQY